MANDAMLRSLLAAGYTPESAVRAVQEAPEGHLINWDLLEHATGLAVRLQPPTQEN